MYIKQQLYREVPQSINIYIYLNTYVFLNQPHLPSGKKNIMARRFCWSRQGFNLWKDTLGKQNILLNIQSTANLLLY